MSETRQLLTKLVREYAVENPHQASVIADQIMETAPDLVSEFISESGQMMFRAWVADSLRWDRLAVRQRSTFAESLEVWKANHEGEEGPPPRLSIFELSYVCGEDYLRKPLGEMTGADHRYVANSYDADSKRSKLYAELHTQIARKVGRKTTAEVFSEDQLQAMFQKFEEV